MRRFLNIPAAFRFALALTFVTAMPPGYATPGWDKCAQSATITLDQHTRIRETGFRRSALRRLLPAVLVTGQTYDFIAICPHESLRRMSAAPVHVSFYQEAVSADEPNGRIVLLPFRAPSKSIVTGAVVRGVTGQRVPVTFSEQALGKTHEQKIIAAVSINNERALVTFVLISASFYHNEIQAPRSRY